MTTTAATLRSTLQRTVSVLVFSSVDFGSTLGRAIASMNEDVMTYHRNSGKGGFVNTSRDPRPPSNGNKNTIAGSTSAPRRGKQVWPNRNKPRG